jgi:hypothetical protein
MNTPSKMRAIRPPGFFLRLWSWFRGLLRSREVGKLLDAATEEATVPFSPPVVSKRVLLADLPDRPRLRPSMVTTARLPKLEPEETTKSPIPTQLISLPLPVSVSPKGTARLSLPIPARVQTLWTPEETQRFEAPRVVSPLEPEKEKPPWMVAGIKAARERFAQRKAEEEQAQQVKREMESAIQSMPDAEEWEEPRNIVIDGSQTMQPVLPADMAPPTLVQARIQDDPKLLDLIKEFEEKHGGSEP